jgi:hypothetical protein
MNGLTEAENLGSWENEQQLFISLERSVPV